MPPGLADIATALRGTASRSMAKLSTRTAVTPSTVGYVSIVIALALVLAPAETLLAFRIRVARLDPGDEILTNLLMRSPFAARDLSTAESTVCCTLCTPLFT